MLERRLDLWLPSYLGAAIDRRRERWRRRATTTHVMFLVCDHFEPRHRAKEEGQPAARVSRWREGYTALRERCQQSFGHAPLHSWFYPPHHGYEHLAALAEYQFEGLGEIELHYHHDGDTSETLRNNLRSVLDEYHSWGLLLESGAPPKPCFGFIHGDWALDNSKPNGKYCGVNDELTILQELGCWGDLTMPSSNDCQTRKVNSIYYAVDDPSQPKSHDWGEDARVGRADPPGFFLMQGPLGINWRAPGYPRIENASITDENWGRPDRIHKWIDCNVHVRGRPEWVFVKLHTHGAVERDHDSLFGEKAFAMHRTLNERFNDGRSFRLHYVTAREAYNIAKAAEHGHSGDPSAYRDFRIAPNATRYYLASAPHRLLHCTAQRVCLESRDSARNMRVRLKNPGFVELEAQFASLDVDSQARTLRLSGCAPGSQGRLLLSPGAHVASVHGARHSMQENQAIALSIESHDDVVVTLGA